jgi:hypothetical protein
MTSFGQKIWENPNNTILKQIVKPKFFNIYIPTKTRHHLGKISGKNPKNTLLKQVG